MARMSGNRFVTDWRVNEEKKRETREAKKRCQMRQPGERSQSEGEVKSLDIDNV